MRLLRQWVIPCVFTAAIVCKGHAVVVAGGDGTQNTTAPADDFGFAHVGRVFDTLDGFYTSGIYLGHGWVLSAYHPVRNATLDGFLFGDVIFGGISYGVNASSAIRLKNADNSLTDLALFQLNAEVPGLNPLVISASTPSGGSSVILAGNGLNREPGLTHWDALWNETAAPGVHSGYKAAGGQSLRWGTNNLEGIAINLVTDVNAGFGVVRSIRTDFDNVSGEAQAIVGDSGGGLFYKRGASWELLGIVHAVSPSAGQPPNTAVFSNITFAANLPDYRSQIISVVPEPSSAATITAAALFLLHRRQRRLP
jgi:hypothetical protein